MEKSSSVGMELRNLRNEITQGRELAERLQIQINAPDRSQEICLFLIDKLIQSYDKALTIVDPDGGHSAVVAATGAPESPPCLRPSPTSLQDCDIEASKDHHDGNNAGSTNKKDMPRWTKFVQVCRPVPGAQVDDGYSWRKYGQKDILGAKYRRGYYRCAYRHSQGCQATKKVQRLDDDPTTVEITYRGNHTCDLSSKLPSTTTRDHQKQESSSNNGAADQELLVLQQQQQQASSSINSDLQRVFKAITDNLDTQHYQTLPYSFNFPSPSSLNHESYTLSPSVVDHSNFFANFSPPGLARSTSLEGSSYLLESPTHIDNFGGSVNVSTSGAQLSEMAPATTTTTAAASSSAAFSPTMDVDFPLSKWAYGSHFGL